MLFEKHLVIRIAMVLTVLLCVSLTAKPLIIFDTDMDSDFDDAGALALLHALADNGECEILAVMHATSTPWSVGVIDAINTYYHQGDLPIGARKKTDNDNRSSYAEKIAKNTARFKHNVTDWNHKDVTQSKVLYKKILSKQKDRSVTIVTVGPHLNLLDLLNDDQAVTLIRKKVKLLSIMGGHFNPPGHTEWNISQKGRFKDGPRAGKAVIERWPTPVMWSDARIGVWLHTGKRLEHTCRDNPVREAYRLALHDNWHHHASWDQSSVLFAVRGLRDYWFAHTAGRPVMYQNQDGNWATDWLASPDSDHSYMKVRKDVSELSKIIEDLMIKPPAKSKEPVRMIFDTDIESDWDDVGTTALLHALADNGEVEILAMGVSATSPLCASCLDVLNTYYGRPDIPIGVLKGKGAKQWPSPYNKALVNEFPHDLKSPDQAPDAALLYRKVLAGQPDHSVVMVTVGFLTNIKNLLQSPPDDYSKLDGKALVRRKVRTWVCMGGCLAKKRPEHNLAQDWTSSVYCFKHWPTPIVFSPFEIGIKIQTGARLRETLKNNPVRRAYEVSNGLNNNASFDQTAVLYAVRGLNGGLANVWDIRRGGTMHRHENGNWEWLPSSENKNACLVEKMAPEKVARIIEDLMMQNPRHRRESGQCNSY